MTLTFLKWFGLHTKLPRSAQVVITMTMAMCAFAVLYVWIRSYNGGDVFLHESLLTLNGEKRYGRTWELSCFRGSIACGRHYKLLHMDDVQAWEKSSGFHWGTDFGPASYLSLRDPRLRSIWNEFGFGVIRSEHSLGSMFIVIVPSWAVVFALGAPAAWLSVHRFYTFWLHHRRTSRINRGLCPQCGYDVRMTGSGCPECGWRPSPECQ
jgi:hypothetical protein